MEQAVPGVSVLSIWVGDQGKSGDPWLEGQGGPFSPFPTLGVTPFDSSLLPHALVDGKPGLPGPTERTMSVGIASRRRVVLALGSAEIDAACVGGISHCQSSEQLLPYLRCGIHVAMTEGLLCSRYRPGAPSPSSHSVSAWWQHYISLLRKLALPSGFLVR